MLIARIPGDDGDEAVVLLNKEGVCQGCPLAMLVLYGVALIPLTETERLNEAVPHSLHLQPWFADDSAVIGPAEKCMEVVQWPIREGPDFGYHPELGKKSWYLPGRSRR